MAGTPIEEAILALAKDFADAGRIIDVDRATFGLEMAYPECSLTTEEIRIRIVEAASQSGVAMFIEGAEATTAATPVRLALPATDPPRPQTPARRPSPLRQVLLRTASFGIPTRVVPPL